MAELFRLSNGMQVVLQESSNIRSVSFGIWVKNGSRNETLKHNGISHFIEHMLFKGTPSRTARDLADEIDAVGGQINAYTSKEYTCYYTRTLNYHFDTALNVLSDMFFNSNFANEDITKECNVIMEEINMYEDTPEELVHDLLQSNIWRDDSLGYPILGTVDTIQSFNHETFSNYYAKSYHPQNTVLAVAGAFNTAEMLDKLENSFGCFKQKEELIKNIYTTTYTPCTVFRHKDIEQVHLALGFPSIPVGSDEAYILSAFNTIFGGGMSSRLFQKIREENGLAYSVYSYNSSYVNTGLFTIYAGLNPANMEQVIEMIINEIKNLSVDKLTDEQLARTKEQIKSNYLMSLESSGNIMNSIGKSQLILGRILTPDQVIAKIDAVNLEKIENFVKQLFKFEKMSISAVGDVDEDKLRKFAVS